MSTQDTTSSERRSERIFKQQLIIYPNDEEEEKRMLLYALRTMIMETSHSMRKHIYVSRVIAIKEKVYDDNSTIRDLQDIAVEMVKEEYIKRDDDFGMTYARAFIDEMDNRVPPMKPPMMTINTFTNG